MPLPVSIQRPRLEDFPYRLTDNVRYADLDPNQHVNNAVYATYFETGRVMLMKDRSYGLMPRGPDLDHGAARHAFPRRVALARNHRDGARRREIRPHLGDVRPGGVFEGKCVASAQSVSVLIDEATRKPAPLTAEIVGGFQPWLRRGVEIAQPTL